MSSGMQKLNLINHRLIDRSINQHESLQHTYRYTSLMDSSDTLCRLVLRRILFSG